MLVPVAPPIVMLLYVKPPPANVLAVTVVLVNKIVDVPAFNVNPEDVPISQTDPVPVSVIVPDPNDIDLVFVLLELNELVERLKLFAANDPDVTVNVFADPIVMLEASWTVEDPTVNTLVATVGTLLNVCVPDEPANCSDVPKVNNDVVNVTLP